MSCSQNTNRSLRKTYLEKKYIPFQLLKINKR